MRIEAVAYGVSALDALWRTVGELKSADPMKQVTIVVPSNIAGITARRHLAKGWGDRKGVAAVELTTLRRLAERLSTPAMNRRKPLTMPIRAAAWRTALADHHGLLEAIEDHPATIDALLASDDELRAVDDDALRSIGETGPLADEVVRLHRGVRELLRSDWYDEVDLLHAAAHGDFASLGAVILYLPQDLTLPEREVVTALDLAGGLWVILGLTGLQRADASLQQWVPEAEFGSLTQPSPVMGTSVMNASDSDDEVRWVVREVLEALGQHRADRVAVLYSRADPYARLLHEQLNGAGVAVNGPGVRSVRERSVARYVLELLALPWRNHPDYSRHWAA